MRHRFAAVLSVVACIGAAIGTIAGAADTRAEYRANRLQAALHRLVDHSHGPPGAIAWVQRSEGRQMFSAGGSEVATGAPTRPDMRMRIAKTAKAYGGGVALSRVEQGVLALDETSGDRLPGAPGREKLVMLAQALHHTSGLPDFSTDTDSSVLSPVEASYSSLAASNVIPTPTTTWRVCWRRQPQWVAGVSATRSGPGAAGSTPHPPTQCGHDAATLHSPLRL